MASKTNQQRPIDTKKRANAPDDPPAPDAGDPPPLDSMEDAAADLRVEAPPAAGDFTVACKFCRRTTEVCRSRLRNIFEWSIALLFVPYRCLYCGYRGFALRFQVPKTPANQEILREVDPGHVHKTKPPVNAS